MFHATNGWLARLARRIYDARTGVDSDGFARAQGWAVEHRRFGVRRYRDPRFDALAASRELVRR